MCSNSHRSPFLIACAVAVAFACSGGTPAMAACSPGAADKPDLAFKDSNCDGIDGDKAAALFVAPGGSDAADGSFGHPKATVAAAVTAGLAAHRDVYVAAGTYDGKVSFLGSRQHRCVRRLRRADVGALRGQRRHDPRLRPGGRRRWPGIVLQLLKIQGLAPGTTTSYGVRAFYSASVALSRTIVEPSAGGAGANGSDAAQSQPAGAGWPSGRRDPNCDPTRSRAPSTRAPLGSRPAFRRPGRLVALPARIAVRGRPRPGRPRSGSRPGRRRVPAAAAVAILPTLLRSRLAVVRGRLGRQ